MRRGAVRTLLAASAATSVVIAVVIAPAPTQPPLGGPDAADETLSPAGTLGPSGAPGSDTPDAAPVPSGVPRAGALSRALVTDSFGPDDGEDLLVPKVDGTGPYVARDGATGAFLWRYPGDGNFLDRADVVGDQRKELLFAERASCGGGRDRTSVTFSVVAPSTGELVWRTSVRLRPCKDGSPAVPDEDELGWSTDLTGDLKPDVVVARESERRTIIVLDGADGSRAGVVRREDAELSVIPHETSRRQGRILAVEDKKWGQMRVLLLDQRGRRIWRTPVIETVASWPPFARTVAVTALNADDVRDVILTLTGETIELDGRDGSVLWRSSEEMSGSFGLVYRPHKREVEDVDHDGINDLLFVRDRDRGSTPLAVDNTPRMVGMLSGRDGEVIWETEARESGSAEGYAFLVPSMTADGVADVAIRHSWDEDETSQLRAIVVLDGRDGSALWETEDHNLIGSATEDVGDVDGDGTPDLWGFGGGDGQLTGDGDGYVIGAFQIVLASGRDLRELGSFVGARTGAESVWLTPIDIDGDGRDEFRTTVELSDQKGYDVSLRSIHGQIWRARR